MFDKRRRAARPGFAARIPQAERDGLREAQSSSEPQWLRWAKRLQTMAQTGLMYARDPHDIERYHAITGIAHEMLAASTGIECAAVDDFFAHEIGHATPKVDVRAAIFRDDAVLLVQERKDGLWSLPGGWADVDEAPSEAAARETLEESGYRVRITRLLALYDKRLHPHPPQPFFVYKLFFEGEIISGRATPSDETFGAAFFRSDELPPLSLDRVLPGQLARLFALHRAPDAAADFD